MAIRRSRDSYLMAFHKLAATIVLAATVCLQAVSAQAPSLRIVVIEGEGAVNIIQQKTAVNPIVEVRDRNNLPISGVAVTFSVGGQSASFAGGASTLTLTTNAAGQAVVTGLTPTATGAVTINATAVVNGQTIAAAITQTNFATAQAAAQAAASAGASSSGASTAGATSGGGGGISGTTIGILGAAVGGAALAATQLAGIGEGPTHSGTFSGQMTLTFPGNSPQQSCSRVHSMNGTLRITLEEGTATGTAEIEGNSVVASGNCGSGPQAGATIKFGMPSTPVTGSAGAVAFTSEVSTPFPAIPPNPSGIDTVRFVFSGALTGNVINGSLAHSIRIESPGSGFPAGTGTATYTVAQQ
jgi:hypothetical protein